MRHVPAQGVPLLWDLIISFLKRHFIGIIQSSKVRMSMTGPSSAYVHGHMIMNHQYRQTRSSKNISVFSSLFWVRMESLTSYIYSVVTLGLPSALMAATRSYRLILGTTDNISRWKLHYVNRDFFLVCAGCTVQFERQQQWN